MNEFTNEDFNNMLNEMESEKQQGTFQSPYWKPTKEGVYQLRIISPLNQFGEKLFYQKRMMHYINNRGYFCLNQTLKDKNGNVHEATTCPICAKAKALYNSSTKGTEEWDLAGKLRAKERYVSRVIVRGKTDKNGNDDEAKPEFWEFGSKIHDYFFNQIKLGEAGNFLSLKDGRDYNLSKIGSGRNTDYSGSSLSMKQSMVFSDTEKLKKLLSYLPDMEYSKLVEFVSEAELKQALNEFLNAGSEDTEEAKVQTFLTGGTPSGVSTRDSLEDAMYASAPAKEEPKEETNIDDLLSMI